jgi:hypothetical protein
MAGLPQIVRRVAGNEPPFSMLPPPSDLAESVLDLLFRGIGRPTPASGETGKPTGASDPGDASDPCDQSKR